MSEFHRDANADDGHQAHSPADLLAEAGLDSRAIHEVLRDGAGAE